MADVVRTEDQIDHELAEAEGIVADGDDGQWPAMSYETGVRDALAWLIGDEDESPLIEHPAYRKG
jgi:hypothetical protein